MTENIFLSYRRDDSRGYTNAIYTLLEFHFGSGQIFMDIDTLVPGSDFVQSLEDAVEGCDIFLAIIGLRWENIKDKEGNRRLENPEDFVRIEVAHALERGIPVIPVLVDGAAMPSSENLPDNLKELARRHAFSIGDYMRTDVQRLIKVLEKTFENLEQERLRLERAEEERKAKEQAEAEKKAAEEKERLVLQKAKAEAERPENIRAEIEKELLAKQKEDADLNAKKEADKKAKGLAAAEKKAAEEKERLVPQKAKAVRLEKEKAEAERLEKEKAEAERLEKERAEEDVKVPEILSKPKKTLKNKGIRGVLFVIVILGIVLILLGRGNSGPLSSLETSKQTPTGIATNTTVTVETEPVDFLSCLVTDVSGIDDKSFNATAWKGMEDAVADFGIEAKYLESQQQTDYEANINAFLEEGCDLIISVGFLLGDATAAAAGANPDQYFGIDVNYLDFPNLYGSGFAMNEPTFLAGYLAAGMSETGIVATYGGINYPSVTIYMDGFVLGVEYYNEVHGTEVQTLGWDVAAQDGLFTGTFESTDDGRTVGESLLDEGADIIMPLAGPAGAGTLEALEERDTGYLIGADLDWSLAYANQSGLVLVSVMKNMDKYVYETIAAVQDGTFAGGNYLGTLENGGVGLSYGSVAGDLISDELKAEIDGLIAGIIAGNVVTTAR